MKLSLELDEKIEALTYHSVHRKKWKVINELLARALQGQKVSPIPDEARDDYPFTLPLENVEKKVIQGHPKKAKPKQG